MELSTISAFESLRALSVFAVKVSPEVTRQSSAWTQPYAALLRTPPRSRCAAYKLLFASSSLWLV